MKRHTSYEWLDFFQIQILDPNGRDFRGNEKLTLEEFAERLRQSTIFPLNLDRMNVLDFIV